MLAEDPDRLTMDSLAERSGLGKGTVFRRFGTRAGIMSRTHIRMLLMTIQLTAALDGPLLLWLSAPEVANGGERLTRGCRP